LIIVLLGPWRTRLPSCALDSSELRERRGSARGIERERQQERGRGGPDSAPA